MQHVPVLLHEVIRLTDPKEGEFVIDGTAGDGGHARAFAEKIGRSGRLLCLDWDGEALASARSTLLREAEENGIAPRMDFVHANYATLDGVLLDGGYGKADIVLLDLGFSSRQIDDPERGFSFRGDGDVPFDMRYDAKGAGPTAADTVNGLGEAELTEIFLRYGEERNARNAAKAIITARRKKKIATIRDFLHAIEPAFSERHRRGKIHYATKIFQALRIYVNREFENLETFLDFLPKHMRPRGRAAIITFHSLEDRIVKRTFRSLVAEHAAAPITKKPVVPDAEERKQNPRSRSAKLRVIEFIK